MSTDGPRRTPARPTRFAVAGGALLLVLGVACAAIAGLSAAGDELEDAGFEIHDLRMDGEDAVYADLERSDGATDVEHFETAAAIIWDHLDDEAQAAEIRLRSSDDTDEIVTYNATELQEIHEQDGA